MSRALRDLRNRLARRDARTVIRIVALLVVAGLFSAIAFHVALYRWMDVILVVLVGLGILSLWTSARPSSSGK
jgi:hypothetical protein